MGQKIPPFPQSLPSQVPLYKHCEAGYISGWVQGREMWGMGGGEIHRESSQENYTEE